MTCLNQGMDEINCDYYNVVVANSGKVYLVLFEYRLHSTGLKAGVLLLRLGGLFLIIKKKILIG